MAIINLLWLSIDKPLPSWGLGNCIACRPTPSAIHNCLESHSEKHVADALLLWDAALGVPTVEWINTCLDSAGDAWHGGLLLGLSGLPKLLDFVQPTWMLNRNPDATIEATSWRLSLRACLIRTEVLRQLGGPDPCFGSLDAASLALGYRYIRNGAFVRHFPAMLPDLIVTPAVEISLRDELRFLQAGFTRRWLFWAGFRSVLRDKHSPVALHRAWREIKSEAPSQVNTYDQRTRLDVGERTPEGKVSVLVPTLHRYPYLRTLLNQLREQTVPPLEILIIDQTPTEDRDPTLVQDFADLPIRYLTLEKAGQCSSRNFGLQVSQGDYILFIDDDDEVTPNLIEQHLNRLAEPGINISNGVAHEIGAGKLPPDFRFRRISNVFPTNNTMIRKEVLQKSGLFDLAYNHGQRADHDLGMRLYLSGELLILNPEITVLHHHAPMGGLREHKARIDTYATSRNNIFKRNLPTVSDLYLAKRYFSDQQVKEMCWMSVLGTFSLKGSFPKRFAKIIVGFLSLPSSLRIILKRLKVACAMLEYFPQIPELSTDEKP